MSGKKDGDEGDSAPKGFEKFFRKRNERKAASSDTEESKDEKAKKEA